MFLAGLLALVGALAAHQLSLVAGIVPGIEQQVMAAIAGILTGATYQRLATLDRRARQESRRR